MVNFKCYDDPSAIFQDDSKPEEMTGTANIALARSFYHSRCQEESHECNSRQYCFDRNAGAVQLYQEDGINLYQPVKEDGKKENENNKEYNFISYGNKFFKWYTDEEYGTKKSTFAHSERILMRDVLDDLISADKPGDIICPSQCTRSAHRQEKEYEVLKYLTDNAYKYKEYLESKKIIVKMWSERPSCTEEGNIGISGGNCTEFIEKICPEGSQFGFIVKDYTRADNENGAPKVKSAFLSFAKAYEAHFNTPEYSKSFK